VSALLVVLAVALVGTAIAATGSAAVPSAVPSVALPAQPPDAAGGSDRDASGQAGGDGSQTAGDTPGDGGLATADGPSRATSPVVPAPRERLVIVHGGDVSLDPSYLPALTISGPVSIWDGVRAAFADAHLVAVNLECPVGPGGVPQDKAFVFRCDPAALPAMRDAGVDLVTLANNHSADHGLELMLSSVETVQRAGIRTVGVGPNERAAHAPQIFELAGWRVAVLGFGGVVPRPDWIAYGDAPGQATGYDARRMAASVAAAAELADVVVVSVHWGAEGSLEPRAEDRVKAQAMIEAGADVIFGHHAHRLQPVEALGDGAVFWNLGNLVWPRLSDLGARTALARWSIEPDGTTQACLVPAEIDASGIPRLTGGPQTCL